MSLPLLSLFGCVFNLFFVSFFLALLMIHTIHIWFRPMWVCLQSVITEATLSKQFTNFISMSTKLFILFTIYTIEFVTEWVKWMVRFSLLEDANNQECSCSNAIYPWQIETMQWFSLQCVCIAPACRWISFCVSYVCLALLLRPVQWLGMRRWTMIQRIYDVPQKK